MHAQRAAWRSKPFEQWSKFDVEQVLNDSAWVAKQEVRIKQLQEVVSVAGSPGAALAVGGISPATDLVFKLRLRSGLPIRAALLREKQLEANYDQLGERERSEFDAKWGGILQCPACAENYVLTLSSSSREEPGADAVYTFLKGAKLTDLQRYVYIANEHGERRPLVHFVPPRAPGHEAIFYFARYNDEGTTLFSAKSKELLFNLTNVEVSMVVNFRIDVSRLLIDDQVSF
jgi:hypothetical protein